MRNIWIISDTHFWHRNILSFTDSNTGLLVRPQFATVEEMNECMADNWSGVVKNGDIVYHLGDVAFHDEGKLPSLMAKLPGSKRLIVGNHDNIKQLVRYNIFKKVQMWRMFPEFGLMFSHVPLHPSGLRRGAPTDESPSLVNVHGHIHQNPSPEGPYFNASVEAINYTPIHVDEVIARTGAVPCLKQDSTI